MPGRHASELRGLSVQWYGKALSNPFVGDAFYYQPDRRLLCGHFVQFNGNHRGTGAATHERTDAGTVRCLDLHIGDDTRVSSLALPHWWHWSRFLIFINPLLASLWPQGVEPPKLHMGYASVIAAHTLFTMSLVIILVRARIAGMDRALIEASMDLYASPWRTFYQVTLPQIYPAILAGFLLSFTFSFDDFIISFFVAGANTTLPIYIFASIRRGITPEVNAIGTMVLAVSLILLMTAQFLLRKRANR